MAKNKKPRKPYHRKPVRSQCVAASDIALLKALICDVSLATEIALPAGTATTEQVNCIKVLINHALTGIMSREWLSPAERLAAIETIDRGGDALVAMVKKAFDRRDKQGESEPRFVCTADELNDIRDAVQVGSQFLTDSLDVAANRTLREFFAMKVLMARGITDPKIEQVNKLVGELSKLESWEWRNYK